MTERDDRSERTDVGLDFDLFDRLLLESTAVGLAILDPDTLAIVFNNRRFAEWFPAVRGKSQDLVELVGDLDPERIRERTVKGRPFTKEVEVKAGRRSLSLSVRVARPENGELPYLVAEVHNVSKLRELEYMIESYSKMVEKQNRTLKREKERAEKLLLNIMPRKVYEEIQALGVATPQRFEAASVLMLDFVDFTEMTISRDPSALIAELNDIFTAFDFISEQFGCERIKTIGDAYMAVSGMPEPSPDHAHNIARAALRFVRYIEKRNAQHQTQWLCRVGINTGPVIGSMVGVQKYVYDIFGPGVNLASRLETLAAPMEIVLTEDMRALIRTDFRFEERDEIDIKGFGRKRLYALVGETRRSESEFVLPDA